MGFKGFHKAKLMMKIFSCKSARSFVAGLPAEAGGAGRQLQPHLGDLLMPVQVSVEKSLL